MNKKFLCKCFITLGLLLFFTVSLPYLPGSQASAQTTVTDKGKSDAYKLNLTDIILAKGKQISLKTYNVGDNAKIGFKSDDQEIASVSDSGVVTACKVGETLITVVIKDGTNATSLSCKVIVGPTAISVKWTQKLVILGINNVDSLNVILKPSNTAEDAKFSSSTPDIVSIRPGGHITANAYGLVSLKAEIDATEADGTKKCDYCTVIVTTENNVSKLETYFSEHTELNKVPEADLLKELSNFFNKEGDPASSSLITNLDKYLNQVLDLD
jgi:hypothetical protein